MLREVKSHVLHGDRLVRKTDLVAPSPAPQPLRWACADRKPWRTGGAVHPVKALQTARGVRYVDALTGQKVKVYSSTESAARKAKLSVYKTARSILRRAAEHRLTALDGDRIAVLLTDSYIQQDYSLLSALQRLTFSYRPGAGTILTRR